ncbi:MAG TPA: hypothetical protein VFX49_10755 [Chloroflexota bacterium]|nr:hypothetical protein [Chloroflexota bacterium]
MALYLGGSYTRSNSSFGFASDTVAGGTMTASGAYDQVTLTKAGDNALTGTYAFRNLAGDTVNLMFRATRAS